MNIEEILNSNLTKSDKMRRLFDEGKSRKEVVEAIRASSFNPEADTEAFVRALAERCKTYDGSTIRTDTFDNTVADLLKAGFLTPCK